MTSVTAPHFRLMIIPSGGMTINVKDEGGLIKDVTIWLETSVIFRRGRPLAPCLTIIDRVIVGLRAAMIGTTVHHREVNVGKNGK